MCHLQVFLKVDEDCAEVTSEGKPFQTRGAAAPKTRSPTVFSLERRTTNLWLDADYSRLRESSSTAHCKSVARYSGTVLYCGSGTQERPDGTKYVLGCAASADHAAEV